MYDTPQYVVLQSAAGATGNGTILYNATNESGKPSATILDTNNDTLVTSPFVDAANGDFDINGTVAGVTEDAWPSSFPTLTNTTPKADKGAVQAGAGAATGGGKWLS